MHARTQARMWGRRACNARGTSDAPRAQVLSLGRMSWEEHSSILGAGAGSSGELSGLLHMDTRLASAYSTLAGPADADAAPSGLPSPTGAACGGGD